MNNPKQKHLNPTQQRIQQLLLDYELDIFTIEELRAKENFQKLELQRSLENLVKTGFLNRLEKGKYCLFNFRDEKVIGNYLAENATIAYWSALNIHGLTEQFPNNVFIQTTKWKKKKAVLGISFRFIKVLERKYTGIITHGHGNHQYKITDIEKTIIDCFDLPQYSGGYAELIRAVYEAELDEQKLIQYCKAIHNIAATKRLAFLIDLFEKEKCSAFLDYAKEVLNKKYSLFNPLGSNKGKFFGKWKLRLNMSKEDVLSIAEKTY